MLAIDFRGRGKRWDHSDFPASSGGIEELFGFLQAFMTDISVSGGRAADAGAYAARPFCSNHSRLKSRDWYLAPPSQRTVTIVWPGPRSRATCTAAATLMPLVLPRKSPSSCNSLYTIRTVSPSSM